MNTDITGWLVAIGGRCYRESERRLAMEEMRQCPACPEHLLSSWKKDNEAYEQHWREEHAHVLFEQ